MTPADDYEEGTPPLLKPSAVAIEELVDQLVQVMSFFSRRDGYIGPHRYMLALENKCLRMWPHRFSEPDEDEELTDEQEQLLRQAEAHEIDARLRASLNMPLGAGKRALDEARRLLAEYGGDDDTD